MKYLAYHRHVCTLVRPRKGTRRREGSNFYTLTPNLISVRRMAAEALRARAEDKSVKVLK